MSIIKTPFRKYSLEEPTTDIITVWLNSTDRYMIEDAKCILRQAKDGTTLKTLAEIGYAKLKGDASLRLILDRFEAFQRRNARTGVVIESPKPDNPNRNSPDFLTGTGGGP